MSDLRFGVRLLYSIQKLRSGSAVIVRHYDYQGRKKLWDKIAHICRRRGHILIIAGDEKLARSWKADGYYYGSPPKVRTSERNNLLRLISVHNVKELKSAKYLNPDLYLISPVYATNSHSGDRPLGVNRLRQLLKKTNKPMIALGGMDQKRFQMIKGAHGYAAIDGLIA